ncbi:effector binding domain-containing protein [Nocardia terpenica]|uniref:AraC family transcriptional regulator n=1 Tax=Nocardia terpenica TaxID=455432 RepID=A0A164KZ06_9NOCA|nr:effector binding domain-containing protein [Nocardia terpenica]KZM71869.1 AraC family transcriptional regulator [Nocardia terpenica]MBF6060476.1 effector binding domain-containing protein [Nocardia terpenica]MBF6103736.1 effector binding domain-containing protein [Nocardia terpenica]MBF6111890.1 effector binding domain-containing protein [Nocardia terpenica]MBF6117957.1 effector binding domain-containing protein [Nocardia terpenica]
MSYSIVVRDESTYAGLVVPRMRPSFKVSNSELIEFLRDRLRDRDGSQRPLYTVYVPDPAGNYNVLVSYDYPAVDAVPVGDVMIRVPKGVYARFEPNGDYHDQVEDVWAQVDDATASAEITRAYREEIEIWRGSAEVELLISILV